MTEESEQAIDWLLALFTGAYPQGRGQLGTLNSGFCCLGVANTVLNLGCEPDDPFIGYGWLVMLDTQRKLAGFNDTKRWSHHRIAQEIVSSPERYLPPSVAQDVIEFFTGPEDWRGWV